MPAHELPLLIRLQISWEKSATAVYGTNLLLLSEQMAI